MEFNADNSNLLRYKAEIELGNIIVGQELYMELCNLEEDLKHNDEYYFDTTSSNKRIYFIEHFLKLTKSPFYGKPMILMLWQKAFIEALYSFKLKKELIDNKKVIDRFKKALLEIGRKNGKSETCSGLINSEFQIGKKVLI